MDRKYTATLARLNTYQIAGLAILTSTAASVAMLLAVRRYMTSKGTRVAYAPTIHQEEPADHFSENFTVPGMTFTGEEVLRQDGEGPSPEGV